MPTPKDTPKRIGDALRDQPKRMGDTLDFYNDSMPRRAVEGLFDKADKPKPAEKGADGFVSGYGGGIPSEAPPVKKTLLNDDLEEHISIYSSKARQARKKTFLEDEPEPEPPRPSPGRIRVPASAIDDDIEYTPAKNIISDLLSRFDIENMPYLKIGIGVFAVIIIFTMISLVIKINTVNARLVEANEKLAKVEDESAEYQQMRIENDGLKQDIENLQTEIEDLQTQLESSSAPSASASSSDDNPPQASQNGASSNEAGVYTVEQGDTLSKIANKFYGNSGDYHRIMEANGLKDTNIFPGQTLRIPPK